MRPTAGCETAIRSRTTKVHTCARTSSACASSSAGPSSRPRARTALAIFCSGPADIFEVIKLPRPVDTGVAIDDSPFIEPLADLAFTGSWGVFLVSRKMARILRGSRDGLEEIARISDDVHGWHDQGGWSQARYQRSIQKEADDHVKHAADVLFRRFKRSPFDKLLIGCPEEQCGEVEKRLHPYLQERIVGRIDVDVENTTPDQVLEAAAAADGEGGHAPRARSARPSGRGARHRRPRRRRTRRRTRRPQRAPRGDPDVRAGPDAPGVVCPSAAGSAPTASTCPVDETPLEQREDIIENAVQLAITQSAEVIPIHHHDDLDGRGSIAAVLRF